MKRLLTIFLILFAFAVKAQDVSPLPSIAVKKLIAPNTPIFYYNTLDSTVWVFKGQYGWTKLISESQVDKKLENITVESGFYKIFPVTTSIITETYTQAYPDTIYKLDVDVWYWDESDGKRIKMRNAVYDFKKDSNGFSLKVDTVAGWVEYSIGGGGGGGGGIEEAPIDGKKYARKNGTWTEIISSSGSTTAISNEVPTGLINGSNVIYSLSEQPSENSERIYLNGIRQVKPTDYSILSQAITFAVAPETSDLLLVDYDIGVVLNQVYNETPSGIINGSNLTFTLANSVVDSQIAVFVNGVRQVYTTDFTVSGSTITFVVAPEANDILLTDYKK